MKSILTSVIALGLAASTALAQLTVNTPLNVIECVPVIITWTGGVAPYILSIKPGDAPNGPTNLVTFPPLYGNSVTWLANILTEATDFGLSMIDGAGTLAQSGRFTIQAAPSGVNCTTATTSFSGITSGTSGATSGNSPATATTSPSNTATGSTTSEKSGASSGASSSAGSPASTKSAGASRVTGQIAAAGVIGAAMVALLG